MVGAAAPAFFVMMKKLKIKAKPVSLATRLAVFIFLINTVVLTSLGVYYARRFSAHIEDGLVAGSSVPVMLMEQNRENFKLVRDPYTLRKLVGRSVDQAMIISPNGKILYSLDLKMEGISLPQLSSRHSLFSQITQTDVEVEIFRPILRTAISRGVASPIVCRGEFAGYLWLVVNIEGDVLAKRQTTLLFFLGGLITILLCGFSQFVLVHHLIIPRVHRMARCVQFVEKGDLYVRIAGSRMHDELGGLETSINRMVAELESRALLQKGLVKDLETARDDAEVAGHCKDAFLANISHELRTPMNAVIGLSELLLNTQLDSEQKEHVEVVLQSGEWLLSILNNILSLVKLEENTVEMTREEMSLRGLFDELHSYYRPFASGCNLEFECVVGEDVPDSVISYKDTLQQIFGNLLLNGFKFTHQGNVRLCAELVQLVEEDSRAVIKFEVQDSGIGISQEARVKVFEAFSQEDDSSTRKYGGVGLGLTISQQLVNLLKGTLELTSEVGTGSSFFFTVEVDLPKKVEEALEVEAEEVSEPEAISEPEEVSPPEDTKDPAENEEPKRPPRVLIVEDNKFNRMVMKTALKRVGCETVEAEDGLLALEVLGLDGEKTGPVDFDLIMMDIQMPNMDGMEATLNIRSRQSDGAPVPIIAVTAHLMEDDCETFVHEHMDGYLPKPVNSEALADILEKHLGIEPSNKKA